MTTLNTSTPSANELAQAEALRLYLEMKNLKSLPSSSTTQPAQQSEPTDTPQPMPSGSASITSASVVQDTPEPFKTLKFKSTAKLGPVKIYYPSYIDSTPHAYPLMVQQIADNFEKIDAMLNELAPAGTSKDAKAKVKEWKASGRFIIVKFFSPWDAFLTIEIHGGDGFESMKVLKFETIDEWDTFDTE